MNNAPSRASQFSALRRALMLASSTLLLASSCNSTPDYGAGNVFVPGQPRYGYGSPATELGNNASRSRTAAPGRSDGTAAGDTGTKPPGRKPPRINRDPNNTVVDLSPPEPKEDRIKDTSAAPPPETSSTTADTTSGTPKTDDAAPVPDKPKDPPTETKKAVTREDLPFGQPVVGRKGYVYSPYAPDKGQVDVVDIPSGTKVKCPYTNKTFRVP
jgi:hypothetical protein